MDIRGIDFTKRSLLGLTATQFFGAFGDNTLKSAFGFLITYQGFAIFGLPDSTSLMIGALLFVSPFFLASGLAGQLADRFNRVAIIKTTRVTEIGLALFALVAIQLESGILLLVCVFLYSLQSAMFGPAKFALLPRLAGPDRLVGWNAALQSATFAGILFGLLAGGFLAGNNLVLVLSTLLVCSAAASLASALLIANGPHATAASHDMATRYGLISGIVSSLSLLFSHRQLAWPALCISWFWTVGLILVSIFPAVAKELLNVTANTANALLAMFVIGIGLGAATVSVLLKSHVSARFAAGSCLLMAVGFIAFLFALGAYQEASTASSASAGMVSFFATANGILIALAMCALAAFSAMFVIPLYAVLQSVTSDSNRGSAHAGGAILDSGIGTLVSVAVAVAFSAGATIDDLLGFMAGLCVLIAIAIQLKYPHAGTRPVTALSGDAT